MSYRALFNWLRPVTFFATMLMAPFFQVLFFVQLGEASDVGDARFYLIGNALQVSATAGLYAMVMTIGGERVAGTLASVLVTPAARIPLFFGRALPVILNGILVTLFTLVAGAWVTGVDIGKLATPLFAAIVLVTVGSCTALGLLLGSIGLVARDVLLGANLTYLLMLLLCGINVPVELLPTGLRVVGELLPITHGSAAARLVADSGRDGTVYMLLAQEAAVGLAYGVMAYLALRALEAAGRRSAALDRY